MKERTNQPALISVAFFSLHVISVRQKNVTLKMTLERMSLTMALSRPLAYLYMCVNELCRKRKPQRSPSAKLSIIDIKGDNKSHTVSFRMHAAQAEDVRGNQEVGK